MGQRSREALQKLTSLGRETLSKGLSWARLNEPRLITSYDGLIVSALDRLGPKRSALFTLMTHHGLRWRDAEAVARPLS
jgi:hypothetical protein